MTIRRFSLCILAGLMLTLSATTAQAAVATFNMDLKNVSMADLVRTMSKLTGRNFLLDNNVSGNVTLIAPTPVSVDEAWRIFLSVLSVRNLALEKSGMIYKIVVAREAVQYNLPVVYGRSPYTNSEAMIVRLIPLEHVKVAELEAFLKNFKGKNGNIYTFASANMLIAVDTSMNINRMLRLIDRLDRPPVSSQMRITEVVNASASEISKLLTDVFGLSAKAAVGGKSAAARRKKNKGAATSGAVEYATRVIADDRSNKLIFIGPESEIKELMKFVHKFDKAVVAGTGQIHVYYLRNADASSLSDTLGRLTQGTGKAKKKKGVATSATAEFEGGIKITADKDTNSLIIVSSPTDFAKLQGLINSLDRPRQQVYVEAAIIEVAVGNNFEFGVNVGVINETQVGGQDGFTFGGVGLGGVGLSALADPSSLAGLNGVFGGLGVIPDSSTGLPPLGVIIRALQSSDSVNILSTPHLLTSDNQEAEIIVGDNVPFITGQNTTSGGNVQSSIERKDVGLTLRITPQINESDRIRLEIYQEISSVSSKPPQGVDVNQQGLITRKRSAKTTVVANDRQTIVIGGLISNEDSVTTNKVPLLGDLPILGHLFRSNTRTKKKTNLLIFLTPRIVRNSSDYDVFALRKAHKFWELQSQAPSQVGFGKFFDENLVGWSEDYDSEGDNSEDEISYEDAGLDVSQADDMFAGESDKVDETSDETVSKEIGSSVTSTIDNVYSMPATATAIETSETQQ